VLENPTDHALAGRYVKVFSQLSGHGYLRNQLAHRTLRRLRRTKSSRWNRLSCLILLRARPMTIRGKSQMPSRRKIDLEKVRAAILTLCPYCGYKIPPRRKCAAQTSRKSLVRSARRIPPRKITGHAGSLVLASVDAGTRRERVKTAGGSPARQPRPLNAFKV